MAKIFIFGNPHSPLVSQRGRIGLEAGHQIDWFWATPFSLPGVRAFSMPGNSGSNLALRALLEPVYLARALATSQPDLLHVHYVSRGMAALPLSRYRPLVATVMGSDVSAAIGYRGVYKPFTKLILDHADRITSKSEGMDRMLLQIGDYASKIERVTWGIDFAAYQKTADISALKQKLGISEDTFVFLDPRGAKPLYNKQLILEAFRKFKDRAGIPAVLLISEFSADQRYLAQLKQLANQWDLDANVRFLPPANQEEMISYYALADVVVSVPSSDGFPHTIYEAWASECFLILSDLPQYEEAVLAGQAAIVVPVGTVEPLTQAMLTVARQPDLRAAHRTRARDFVIEHADMDQQKQRILKLYSKLLAVSK